MSDSTPTAPQDAAAAAAAAAAEQAGLVLHQTPVQPGLQDARRMLMQWPDQADAAEVQALVDSEFVLAFNGGTPEVWGPWQARRLNELLGWITQSLWWQQWTRLTPEGNQSLPLSEIPIMSRKQFRDSLVAGAGNAEAPSEPDVPTEHRPLTLAQTAGRHAESHNQGTLFWLTAHQVRMAAAHYRANHYQQGRDPARAVGTLSDEIAPHPGAACLAAGSNALAGENCHEGHAHWGRSWHSGSALEHAQWLSANPVPFLSTKANLLSQMLDAFEANPSLSRPAIEQIITQGQPIDLRLRQRTRAVLGARIADVYTCEEVGPIAVQCPHSSDEAPHYHMAVTNAVVQIVRKDKGAPTRFGYLANEGELGRVILTGLHNFSSPVLRQDTGDTARLFGRCPVCGNLTPTLTDLAGSEHLRLRVTQADGSTARLPHTRVTGQDWQQMLGQVPTDARLLQMEPTAVRVEVVLGQPLSDVQAAQAAVQAGLAQRIHPGLAYRLHVMPAIDWPNETPAHLRHPIESLLRDATPAGAKA
jgi:hypothetical protein